MGSTETIPRLAALTRERFVREYLDKGRPVVLSREPAAWGPMSRWNPDHLVARLGDKEVRVAVADDGMFDYDATVGKTFRRATLPFSSAAAVIAAAQPDRSIYLMQQSIGQSFAELAGDVRTPDVLGDKPADPHLWFGSAGNVTPLHHDPLSNLFLQIHGRKRFTLFSPRHFGELYPFPADSRFSHMSYVDVERPDLDRFPRFPDAQRFEIVLAPGDLLFLPPFWWHHVRSLEVSVSVNFWSAPTLADCLVPAGLRLLATVYERDRLETMGAPFRDRAGAWMGAARKAHTLGVRWPAVMLASAGLELPVRARCRQLGIVERDAGGLRALADINDDLFAAGAYSRKESDVIARLDLAFQRARQRRDDLFDDAEVDEILTVVAALAG
jgi:hypothetical protein